MRCEIIDHPVVWVVGTIIHWVVIAYALSRKGTARHGYITIAFMCLVWYPTMAFVSLFGMLYYDPMIGPMMYVKGVEPIAGVCVFFTMINAESIAMYIEGMGKGPNWGY